MKIIQAKKHKIGTYEIDKTSLSCFDDKRYVLDDGTHTLAYFHKDCNKKYGKYYYIGGHRGSFIFLFLFYEQFLHTKKDIKSE